MGQYGLFVWICDEMRNGVDMGSVMTIKFYNTGVFSQSITDCPRVGSATMKVTTPPIPAKTHHIDARTMSWRAEGYFVRWRTEEYTLNEYYSQLLKNAWISLIICQRQQCTALRLPKTASLSQRLPCKSLSRSRTTQPSTKVLILLTLRTRSR